MARAIPEGGSLSLGVDVGLSDDTGRAHGTLDLVHRMGGFHAFAKGFGGMTRIKGDWRTEIGMTAGLGLEW